MPLSRMRRSTFGARASAVRSRAATSMRMRSLRGVLGRLGAPGPVRRVLLGFREGIQILEAWRHRRGRAGKDLMMLDIKRAQPALLAHGQCDEIPDLDQLRLAEKPAQAHPQRIV